MHAFINGWKLPLLEGAMVRDKRERTERSFTDSIVKNAKDIKGKVQSYLLLFKGIETENVIEYFGGVGVCTTIVRKVLNPTVHEICEYSHECIEQLKFAFGNEDGVSIVEGDSYENVLNDFEAELVILDHNSFTVKTLIEDERTFRMYATLANRKKTKWFISTDVAISKLHMNKLAYSKFIGKQIETMRDYVEGFSEFLYQLIGFGCRRVAHHRRAAYILFERGYDKKPEFITEVDCTTGFDLIH